MAIILDAFGEQQAVYLGLDHNQRITAYCLDDNTVYGWANVPYYDFVDISPVLLAYYRDHDMFLMKTYSENSSWVFQLLDQGYFEATPHIHTRKFPTHQVHFPVWKLTQLGKEAIYGKEANMS